MPERKAHHNKDRQEKLAQLTELREQATLSQKELARELSNRGIERMTRYRVCKIETGDLEASPQVLRAWAVACGVRPEVLLGPQLELRLLSAIVAPQDIRDDLLEEVKAFLVEADEQEKQELRRHLAFIRLKSSSR